MNEMIYDSPAEIPTLALRPREAAKAIGISERKLSSIMADRTSGIPHFRLGSVVLFPIRELTEWLTDQVTPKQKIRKTH